MKTSSVFLLGTFLIFYSCSEIIRKECRVTGAFKEYEFPNGYIKTESFASLNSNLYKLDTCSQIIDGNGCGIVINSTGLFNELVTNSKISIQVDDNSLLDLENRILVGIKTETDWGTKIHDSVFVGYNSDKKELLIRCQYELSHQCAGSQISSLLLQKLISIPKIFDLDTIVFSVENVNPLN